MPLLMHQVWEKIFEHAQNPRPEAFTGARRREIRQPVLATLMRTSIFFNLLVAPMLYHSPIIDDPLRFVYGYNETIPVHPSIQTKGELLALVQKLFIEYPDLTMHPTYYQLARFSGSYWHDVGIDRTKLHRMPFERYCEYTNRLRMFLGAIKYAPGAAPPPPPAPAKKTGDSPSEGEVDPVPALAPESVPAPAKSTSKSTTAARLKSRFKAKSAAAAAAVANNSSGGHYQAFPHLQTISLCAILGHPTDSWMPSVAYASEMDLVKTQRETLWRWIKRTGVKHVCAHNGESALGLPWEDTVERQLLATPPSANGKDAPSKKSEASAAATATPSCPEIRLHLNDVMHAPVMVYNAKMTWDMPHWRGRRVRKNRDLLLPVRAKKAKDTDVSGKEPGIESSGAENGTIEAISVPTKANATSIGRSVITPAPINGKVNTSPSSAPSSKSALPFAFNAVAGPSRLPADRTLAAQLIKNSDIVTADKTQTLGNGRNSAPTVGKNGQAPLAGIDGGEWTWLDTEAMIEKALYMAMHHGHMGVTSALPAPAPDAASTANYSAQSIDAASKYAQTLRTPHVLSTECPVHGAECGKEKGSSHAVKVKQEPGSPLSSRQPNAFAQKRAAGAANASGNGHTSTKTSIGSTGTAPTAASVSGANINSSATTTSKISSIPAPAPPKGRGVGMSLLHNRIDLDIYVSPYHLSSEGTFYEHAHPSVPRARVQSDQGIKRTDLKTHRAMAKRSQAAIERSLGYGNLDQEGGKRGRDRIKWGSGPDAPICMACGFWAEGAK